MSVSEDVSCPTENSVTVQLDSASVSDAETVFKKSNVHSCHVEEGTVSAEPENDSELLKGLLTDTFCQVCEAVLMFESQRVSHYEGKKHAQRVRIYLQAKKAERNKLSCESSNVQSPSVDPEKFCSLCNMVFSSPMVAKSHYVGKVHAKNTRKSSVTSSLDARSAAPPVVAMAVTAETSPQVDAVQKQKESTTSAVHRVDLSDPDKYCKLCAASFNNPMMASEHYNGRKHQRSLARQEQHRKLEESKHTNCLTCPLCHMTLSSIDAYQAHIKDNKHHIKENTQEDSCKKKVYDSFQDELADYIQQQRSRGLEPKTGQISEPQGLRYAEHELDEGGKCHIQPQTTSLQSRLLASAIRPQPQHPPFHPRPNPGAFRGRFLVPNQRDRGYTPYPPPLIPGLTGRALRRARSPGSLSSSSSFSDSSSSYSSSEDSNDRRTQRKKSRVLKRKRKDGDSREDLPRGRRTRENGSTKNSKRQQESSEEDRGKKWKEKKHKATKKRQREEFDVEMVKGDRGQEGQSEGPKEEKTKHRKEKKKTKERGQDNRTEEEKLWDATILGI